MKLVLMNDTYVNLDKLSFSIDQDVFNAKANIKNIAKNALVDAALKGTINLGNLSKAYPIKLRQTAFWNFKSRCYNQIRYGIGRKKSI